MDEYITVHARDFDVSKITFTPFTSYAENRSISYIKYDNKNLRIELDFMDKYVGNSFQNMYMNNSSLVEIDKQDYRGKNIGLMLDMERYPYLYNFYNAIAQLQEEIIHHSGYQYYTANVDMGFYPLMYNYNTKVAQHIQKDLIIGTPTFIVNSNFKIDKVCDTDQSFHYLLEELCNPNTEMSVIVDIPYIIKRWNSIVVKRSIKSFNIREKWLKIENIKKN